MTFLLYPVTVMLCLGGIYAWSIVIPGLQEDYGFSASQTQWVFGSVIATFTTSMLVAHKLVQRIGYKRLLMLTGVLFCTGYLLAAFSSGNFWSILLGIGLISGIATGFGYMISLTSAVQYLPTKKGLVTGIVSAGFGGGSIILTIWGDWILMLGYDVLQLFGLIGLIYGILICVMAYLMPTIAYRSQSSEKGKDTSIGILPIMFMSMLMGTFAGLMVIGNIKLMGDPSFTRSQLSLAIVLFSAANFGGRLVWGMISDRIPNSVLLPLALLIQGVATYFLGNESVPIHVFYALVLLVGFGFASNFVLLAKEVAHVYGVQNLGRYYPFIFLGYGLAGVLGPVTGGYLFDQHHNFIVASNISLLISIAGGGLFLCTILPGKRWIRSMAGYTGKI